MKMHEKLLYVFAGIATVAVVACMSSCRAEWWRGEDKGEIYEEYTEQMQEMGLYPDVYGYGW